MSLRGTSISLEALLIGFFKTKKRISLLLLRVPLTQPIFAYELL
jgi:hypothetical protein